MTQYIPWGISFLSLVVCVLTYLHNTDKDEKQSIKEDNLKMNTISESLIKANMKLDQVCSTTNETRTDIKSLNKDIQNMDVRIVALEKDMKTVFGSITEIKERLDYEN